MAKENLAMIVGKDQVSDAEQILSAYGSDESFVSPGLPAYVVKVKTAQQVQQIINYAKEKRMPVIPVSSPGGPRLRGDTIASQGGMILDLSGMDRILNVDRMDKIAVIEPGVTFDQLEQALRQKGLRAFKPLLPRRTKSVLASYLEREPVVVPRDHWDAIDPLVTMEVIFGTGDLFRTGSASSPPADLQKQLDAGLRQCFAAGPGSTSLSRVVQGSQGTMGVVTWGSVICGILPEIDNTWFLTAATPEPLIDLSYQLSRRRLGEEHFLVNAFQFATMMADKGEIAALAEKLPAWILTVKLTAGGMLPEEQMAYQEKDLRELAQARGVELKSAVMGISGKALAELLDNPPEEFYKMKHRGAFQDIFFTTTLDKTPGHVAVMEEVVRHHYPSNEIGIYLQPMVQGSSCHCEFNLAYDPTDRAKTSNLKALYLDAGAKLAGNEAFFSRPYGPWADLVYGKNGEATALLKRVKKMLDPEGILNPGRLCF
ncbi:MAG: FAD-binding oxidoreductase [Desulfuromonadaceae bacterium]|nr:FAD-binding oxidoreductase [Desulfuromonadaceae bacterium]